MFSVRSCRDTLHSATHSNVTQNTPLGANLIVLERFGANGEAAKFDGLLVAGRNIQVLELLAAIPGQFIRPQLPALLGKDV